MRKRLVVVTLLGFVVGCFLLEFLQTQEKADLVEKEKVEHLADCITRKSCSELIETVQLLGKHVKILGVQSYHPDIFIAVYPSMIIALLKTQLMVEEDLLLEEILQLVETR